MKKVYRERPRVLLIDIETAPLLANVWGLFDQTVGLNQVERDWHLLAVSAKWLGDPPTKVEYRDQRKAKNLEDDKKLARFAWQLLDEADVVIAHNGNKFDIKKLNARFLAHGFQPPSSFRKIDTFLLAKKHFGFTSNKLEYLSEKFCKEFKKSKHTKFPGFELWKEVMRGNKEAWAMMESYAVLDVLALEELYQRLAPWDSFSFTIYQDEVKCKCGSEDFKKWGWFYTANRKYQRFKCKSCGYEWRATKCARSAAYGGIAR